MSHNREAVKDLEDFNYRVRQWLYAAANLKVDVPPTILAWAYSLDAFTDDMEEAEIRMSNRGN